MRTGFALALALSLAACDSGDAAISNGEEVADTAQDNGDSEEEKGGETYPQYDARRDSYAGTRGEFGGQGCTVDCGGHEAGYAWAEEKGITDPDNCGGKSWSFIEGCQAYAKEHEDY